MSSGGATLPSDSHLDTARHLALLQEQQSELLATLTNNTQSNKGVRSPQPFSSELALPIPPALPLVEPEMDRRAPIAGGFNHLLSDLITLAGESLSTRELLTLRRVSRHWSGASRVTRSWVHSSWSFRLARGDFQQQWANLSRLCDAVPHLRDLTLRIGEEKSRPQGYAALSQLHSLERLILLAEQPDAILVQNLPKLRHIQVVDAGQGFVFECTPSLAAVCAKEGLVSLRRVGDTVRRSLEAISNSMSAPVSLLALELRIFAPFDTTVMERFCVLEELSLMLANFFDASFRALDAAPNLRLLSLSCMNGTMEDGQIDALLSTTLSKRLEHLSLMRCSFGRASVRNIMRECTALLVFGLHYHVNACLRTITKEEWTIQQSEPDLAPEVVWMRAATISGRSVPPMSRQLFQPGFLDLGIFVSGPQAFRHRLLALELSGSVAEHHPRAFTQCRQRFPRLAHLILNDRNSSPLLGDDSTAAWMPEVTGDSQALRPSLTPADLRYARTSTFRFVRALKLVAGIALLPTEVRPSPFRP